MSRFTVLLAFVIIIVASSSFFVRTANARAVNISNTWMLPEEGFPVFYRYFRDRISWYEADAVCQFHHANLVTVDNTSQYDAIRAYLKELDINENVWIGLSRGTFKPDFTWRDFRTLSGDGYWQEAIPNGNDPLCVAMDPSADFRWHAMPCSGQEIASFICELPVPSWAIGAGGCLLNDLPSLTVLYVPERSAIELTSDCGLDGTKRIACKGNADRDSMTRQLACTIIADDDFDDTAKPTRQQQQQQQTSATTQDTTSSSAVTRTPPSSSVAKTTKPWSNTVDDTGGDDGGDTTGSFFYDGQSTRHRRETDETANPVSTSTRSTNDLAKDDITTTTIVTRIENETIAAETTSPDPSTTSSTVAPLDGAIGSTVDYPETINQGQLFSVIENGTMFDIIALNDTSDGSAKKAMATTTTTKKTTTTAAPPPVAMTTTSEKTTAPSPVAMTTTSEKTTPASPVAMTTTNKKTTPSPVSITTTTTKQTTTAPSPVTTVIYHKEPPETALPTTEKQAGDGNLTKELPFYLTALKGDASTPLNRTFRKQLPSYKIASTVDLDQPKQTNETKQRTLIEKMENVSSEEIMRHQSAVAMTPNPDRVRQKKKMEREKLSMKLARKKVADSSEISTTTRTTTTTAETTTTTAESTTTSVTEIDGRPSLASSIVRELENYPEAMMRRPWERPETVNFLLSTTTEASEPEPQTPSRPNRQRQLTRPQRRSFYPYFFSRVLG